LNEEQKIYFVLGDVEGTWWSTSKVFLHPYFGRIELQEEIGYWGYGNLGIGMYRGKFITDEPETRELYTISYSQENFYLLSCEAVDQETAIKIFYSIH
jgi:hypothetical protein